MNKLIREEGNLIVFHPGKYLGDVIADLGINHNEFAIRTGIKAKTISLLLSGKANVSMDIAAKLSQTLGTSARLWLNLQITYEEKIIEIKNIASIEKDKQYLAMIDYGYFVKNDLLPMHKSYVDKIIALRGLLKIHSLAVMTKQDLFTSYKMVVPKLQIKNVLNSKIWVQLAINASADILCRDFDKAKLKKTIPDFAKMAKENSETTYIKLGKKLAECGIALVILPYLPNSGINGAVKWINGKYVLALNDRRKNANYFWFTFFHEIYHVLEEKKKDTLLLRDETCTKSTERDADSFAEQCIKWGD